MELNFAELEEHDMNTNVKSKAKTNAKSNVSYDDILNSLNLKVNNGKLEYVQPSQKTTNQFKTCYKKQEIQQQNPYQNNNYVD